MKSERKYRRIKVEGKCKKKKKKQKQKRRRGKVKSSELDKKTCGVLVKGTRVSGVRQSADERLPK